MISIRVHKNVNGNQLNPLKSIAKMTHLKYCKHFELSFGKFKCIDLSAPIY